MDYSQLRDRFQVGSEEELAAAVRECLLNGVAFLLSPKHLKKALRRFECSGSVTKLSEIIKEQLVRKLST